MLRKATCPAGSLLLYCATTSSVLLTMPTARTLRHLSKSSSSSIIVCLTMPGAVPSRCAIIFPGCMTKIWLTNWLADHTIKTLQQRSVLLTGANKMDLNALFGEFLKKAIEAAVEEKTKELMERITELEQQVQDLDSKVDDCDVERAVERHMEGMNINEMLDLDNIVEEVVTCRQFNVAVKESLIDTLSRSSNY